MKAAKWLLGRFPSPVFRRPMRPLTTEQLAAIKQGRFLMSGGAFARVNSGAAGMGDTLTLAGATRFGALGDYAGVETNYAAALEFFRESPTDKSPIIAILQNNLATTLAKRGDLVAAANVTWVIGREGRGEFDESLAGK